MFMRSIYATLLSTLFAGSASATLPPRPVYFPAGQYTAELQQHARHWRLQPLEGADTAVTYAAGTCANAVTLPDGVWFVTRGVGDQPELLAPSSTALPTGFPERVPLRVCGDENDAGPTLAVPAVVFDWLRDHVGSVLIDE